MSFQCFKAAYGNTGCHYWHIQIPYIFLYYKSGVNFIGNYWLFSSITLAEYIHFNCTMHSFAVLVTIKDKIWLACQEILKAVCFLRHYTRWIFMTYHLSRSGHELPMHNIWICHTKWWNEKAFEGVIMYFSFKLSCFDWSKY